MTTVQPRGRAVQLPQLSDLHLTIRDLRIDIGSVLDGILACKEPSTFAKRMERCTLVQSFYDACAVLGQLAMFHNAELRDPNEELDVIFTSSVKSFFSKMVVGDSHEVVSAQYRDLRRAIVECRSMLQPLTSFQGKDYVETTIVHIAAKSLMTIPNFGSQQMMAGAGFSALPELRQRFAAREASPKPYSELRDQIRDCFRFAMDLTFGNERPRLISGLRNLYIDAVVEQQTTIVMSDVDVYLEIVSNELDREFTTAAYVLSFDPSAPEAVKLRLQKHLLAAAATKAIVSDSKSGVVSTLQYPHLNPVKFRVLLNVLDFSAEAVLTIKQAFETCVTEVTGKLLQADPNTKSLPALTIAEVHASFSAFITAGTQDHHRQPFLRVLNRSVASVFDSATLAVVVADELNSFIRKAPKLNLPQLEITKTVDSLASLVPAACDLVLFTAVYRQRLSQRLLTTRRPSVPLEEFVLKRLAIRLSIDEVASLFHMLKEAVHVRPVEGVSLCNTLMWPAAVREYDASRLPAPLSTSAEALVDRMNLVGRHPHLDAKVDYWLSTGVITISVKDSKCSVYGIIPQLAVLTHLFTEVEEAQKVNDIAARVGMDPVTCFSVLVSLSGSGLVHSGNKLFAAEPKGVEDNNGKKITLSSMSSSAHATSGVAGLPNESWPSTPPPATAPAKAPTVPPLVERHQKKKDEANGLFKIGKYTEALKMYRECLKMTASVDPTRDSEVANMNHTIHSNIVLTLLKMKRYSETIMEANDFFMAKPMPSADLRRKVASRRGQASMELGDLESARSDFMMAQSFLGTRDTSIDALLQKVEAKIAGKE